MDAKYKTELERRTRIIKALAHPTRLFLVDELMKNERCVCELTDMVGVDVSTISKHLAILKEAGILEDEKRGLQVCYRLKMSCVSKFLDCVDAMACSGKKKFGGRS